MSRIFEALQHAEKDRSERDASKLLFEQRAFQTGHTEPSPAGPTNSAHSCFTYAVRVSREGIIDFMYRWIGLYPWQCTRCRRCFHRSTRNC